MRSVCPTGATAHLGVGVADSVERVVLQKVSKKLPLPLGLLHLMEILEQRPAVAHEGVAIEHLAGVDVVPRALWITWLGQVLNLPLISLSKASYSFASIPSGRGPRSWRAHSPGISRIPLPEACRPFRGSRTAVDTESRRTFLPYRGSASSKPWGPVGPGAAQAASRFPDLLLARPP